MNNEKKIEAIVKAIELHQKFGFKKSILAYLAGVSEYELDVGIAELKTPLSRSLDQRLTNNYCSILDLICCSTICDEALTINSLTEALNKNYRTRKNTKRKFFPSYTSKLLESALKDGYIQIKRKHPNYILSKETRKSYENARRIREMGYLILGGQKVQLPYMDPIRTIEELESDLKSRYTEINKSKSLKGVGNKELIIIDIQEKLKLLATCGYFQNQVTLIDNYYALLHSALNHKALWYSTLFIEELTINNLTDSLNNNYLVKRKFNFLYTRKLLESALRDGYIQIYDKYQDPNGLDRVGCDDFIHIEAQEKLKALSSCEYFQNRIALSDD